MAMFTCSIHFLHVRKGYDTEFYLLELVVTIGWSTQAVSTHAPENHLGRGRVILAKPKSLKRL